MGSGYVIEHCVTALSIIQKENLFKNYIADTIYAIGNLVGNAFGAGDIILRRYADLINPQDDVVEEKTEQEVIEHIQNRLKALG